MITQSTVFQCEKVNTNGLYQAIISRDFAAPPFNIELLEELEEEQMLVRVTTSPVIMDAILAVYEPLGEVSEWEEYEAVAE